MSLTRRRFLESASLTVLASAALPAAFAQSTHGLKDDPFSPEAADVLANASEETFKPLIGESFEVMKGGGRLDTLTLQEVNPAAFKPAASKPRAEGASAAESRIAAKAPGQAVNSFALRFHGSGASTLPEGTYTVDNEALGSFPLFLAPTGPDSDPHRYTAYFSLLVP